MIETNENIEPSAHSVWTTTEGVQTRQMHCSSLLARQPDCHGGTSGSGRPRSGSSDGCARKPKG